MLRLLENLIRINYFEICILKLNKKLISRKLIERIKMLYSLYFCDLEYTVEKS